MTARRWEWTSSLTSSQASLAALRFVAVGMDPWYLKQHMFSGFNEKSVTDRRLIPFMLQIAMEQPRQLDPARLGDHVDRLFRAAWAMCGSREDAEDLVQETYAKVLAKPRFLRNDDDLGYLLS